MTEAEPIIAEKGIKYGPKKSKEINRELKTIANAAPNAAPAETPINPGSAKGFLNRPCRHAPEIANEAPTKAASITLGIRIV